MHKLEEKNIQCPYCGETINVLIDTSVPHQNYIEDCQVCCRPINFDIVITHDDDIFVSASHENE